MIFTGELIHHVSFKFQDTMFFNSLAPPINGHGACRSMRKPIISVPAQSSRLITAGFDCYYFSFY